MKATAERTGAELTGRGLIAGEVRAVLARKKLNSNNLPDNDRAVFQNHRGQWSVVRCFYSLSTTLYFFPGRDLMMPWNSN